MTEARSAARVAHGILTEVRALRAGLQPVSSPLKAEPKPENAAFRADLESPEVTTMQPRSSSSPPIRVFVSWAHTNEDWKSEQARDWERRVIAFTTILRGFGINADVDLYHGNDPKIDWTRFGQASVVGADFVIIVNSLGWGQRWSGTNTPTLGAGAVVEADALKGMLQANQETFQSKVLLVKLPGPGRVAIPADLNRINRFTIDPEDPDTFDGLLRTLTGQPEYQIPELGEVPILPANVVDGIDMRKRRKTSREFSAYEALREEADRIMADGASPEDPVSARRLTTLMGLLDALQQ